MSGSPLLTRLATSVVRILGSLGLSMTVFAAMFVLVLLGTYAQVDSGIYQAQRTYFHSWYFFIEASSWTLPFPGGLLLMSLLSLNLVIGGVLRLRRGWSRFGILICHLGILMLMAAGFIKYLLSDEGYMRLNVGEASGQFVSYHEREIVITQLGAEVEEAGQREWRVPQSFFGQLDFAGNQRVTYDRPELPFRLQVERLFLNARVEAEGLRPADQVATPIVDGRYISARLTDKNDEKNAWACYVAVLPRDSGESGMQRGILSELEREPCLVESAAERWAIRIRRRHYDLPFVIELEDFQRRVHPQSGRPLSFSSQVAVKDSALGGSRGKLLQRARIEMNKPLRRGDFILFQSSWGKESEAPNARLYSIFSVVRNPADQWPLWACLVVALGMLLHFSNKLFRFVRSQLRQGRLGQERSAP